MMKCTPLAAIALACALGLTACGDGSRPADFVYAIADEHRHLDPQRITWVHDGRVSYCLFEPLVSMKTPELTVEPGVAARWEISDDGRTYTFHLRAGAKWSSGDPVVAGDFVYAWRRALTPDVAADYSQLLFPIEGAKEFFEWRSGQLAQYAESPDKSAALAAETWQAAQDRFAQSVAIAAPDDRTLVVRLLRPVPYFLELCAFTTFMPVHPLSVDKATSVNAATGMLNVDSSYFDDPARLITNGPYVLSRRRFKRDLLMTANPHYWNRAAMRNGSILEKIVAETQTALLQHQQRQIDWVVDIPTASSVAADLVAQQRPDVHPVLSVGHYFYNFNCMPKLADGSDNPLADPRVRQALSMAIDRQAIVAQVTRLNQPVARSFVPVGAVPGYEPAVEAGIDLDVQRARALLDEAGYPGGQGLDGLSILYNTGFGHETIAQQIQRAWDDLLGVRVELEGVEVKAFGERLRRHQFTICRASWFGDYRDPTTWLDKMVTGNGNNDCGYSNVEYDALMRLAQDEPDPAARFALLHQAEATMLADAPMAQIYQYINLYVHDPSRVQGLDYNPWSRWRLEFVKVNR